MLRTISLGLAAAVIAVLAALMWTQPGYRPPQLGPVANFTPALSPGPAPQIRFVSAEGKIRTLAEFTKPGRAVLMNFWATWCAPCVAEMPSLERLQLKRGGETFVVIALSEDREGWKVMPSFLSTIGVRALAVFHDKDGEAATRLGVTALPTTILFGPDGREIGRLVGPAEWDGPAALALLKKYLGG